MNLIAKIKGRREAKRKLKASLGEFARSYNELQDKIDRNFCALLGGIGALPSSVAGVTGLVLAFGDAKLGLSVVFAALGWSMIVSLPVAMLSWWPAKKLLPLSKEIYSAAGIDANPGFSDRLIPGKKVASFDHSFPDGRSGHVEVICDNEGYPMVLFKENMPAAVLPAPRMREIAA